jgi:kynurenine formamidase
MPVHGYLLATTGTPFIENAWLEELAADKQFECAFFGGPLKVTGATGAPMRPFALPLDA